MDELELQKDDLQHPLNGKLASRMLREFEIRGEGESEVGGNSLRCPFFIRLLLQTLDSLYGLLCLYMCD